MDKPKTLDDLCVLTDVVYNREILECIRLLATEIKLIHAQIDMLKMRDAKF